MSAEVLEIFFNYYSLIRKRVFDAFCVEMYAIYFKVCYLKIQIYPEQNNCGVCHKEINEKRVHFLYETKKGHMILGKGSWHEIWGFAATYWDVKS